MAETRENESGNRSGRQPLTSCFAVALVLFALINIAFAGAPGPGARTLEDAISDKKPVPMIKTFTGWTARAYLSQKAPPDVVVLGSSQMGSATFAADAQKLQSALDCLTHRRIASLEDELSQRLSRPVRVFNWALGGEMVSDGYMISRALLHGRLKPKLVVIGLNPRDFIDNSLQYPGMTEPFRFFAPYVDVGHISTAAYTEPFPWLEWAFDRDVPLRRLRMSGLKELSDGAAKDAAVARDGHEFIKTISGGLGDVDLGEWVIPANMPFMFIDNTKEYKHRFRDPSTPLYAAEMKFFEQMLKELHDDGIKVMVVGMPSLWTNRALLPDSFWKDWRSQMASACTRYGAGWVDMTDSDDSFSVNDFLDTVHMNAAGGQKFFAMLAQWLSADDGVRTCLDSGPQPTAVAGSEAVPR